MELGFIPEDRPRKTGDRPDDPAIDPPAAVGRRLNLEIEVTTRCNLFCPSCPRTAFADRWIHRDMAFEDFERALSNLTPLGSILFRGWGEPLLNPDLERMAAAAKETGARLVLSTNGLSPIKKSLMRLLDWVIFRLDVGRARHFEMRNPHAKFNRLIFNISRIRQKRLEMGENGPGMMALFVKNRYTLDELDRYLLTAVNLRMDQVGLYSPTFHVRPVDAEGELPGDLDPDRIRMVDAHLAEQADAADLTLINPAVPGRADARTHCSRRENKSLFVNWRGELGMCRYSALPVVDDVFTRLVGGREETLTNTLFGSLFKKPLPRILDGKRFRRFKRACRPALGRPGRTACHYGLEAPPDAQPPAFGDPDPGELAGLCPALAPLDYR